MISHLDLQSILIGLISGGSLVKIAEFGIAWTKERREQRSGKTAHQKDRPRFRIDITMGKTSHASIDSALVKILSLGGLPITINKGEIFIESSDYPERVESKQLNNREISAVAPIELKFSLPQKFMHPIGGGEPAIKLVCHFSYQDNQEYRQEWNYNRRSREFE